jgi:LEA14-like dessication related protein
LNGKTSIPLSPILQQIEFVRTLSLLTLLTVIALSSCQKPQAFDYRSVKNVKLEKLGFEKSTLNMDLVYYNPNNFGVDLRKVDCDIYIDNHYLGKYKLDTLMHIQRKAEFVLPSRIQVDMQGIFKNVLTVLFNKEVLVNVKGTTRVGKAGFFKTISFNYEARHKIDLGL